jgi:hypothetical protein
MRPRLPGASPFGQLCCVRQSVVNTIRLYETVPQTSWGAPPSGISYTATYDKVMSFLAANGM